MNKKLLALPIAATLMLGLGACSGSTSDDPATTPSSTSSTTSSAPTKTTEAPDAPLATIDPVTKGVTSVALDQGFLDAITSLGLTPGVVGTATLADGALNFPVTGGSIDYYGPDSNVRPYVQGDLLHQGSGFSLTSADGATVVELTDFVIDPGKPAILKGTVNVNGAQAVPSTVLFDLNGKTLKPIISNPDGSATLTGTEVLLNAGAADLLNQTFGTDALAGGFKIGVSTITIA